MWYAGFKQLRGKFPRLMAWMPVILSLVTISTLSWGAEEGSVPGKNRLLSIQVDGEKAPLAINLQTQDPVGYRYTVYDSFNPVRVVVDFPGMDVSAIASPVQVNTGGVSKILVSSLDLPTGQVGRTEFLLERPATYNVFLSENNFQLSFSDAEGKSAAQIPAQPLPEKRNIQPPPVPRTQEQPDVRSVPKEKKNGTIVKNVDIEKGRASLLLNGLVDKYKYFDLGAPPRLVVDIYGVRPDFNERFYRVSQGFDQLRIGTYEDRTRFVFDAEGGELPAYQIEEQDNMVVVSWNAGKQPNSKKEAGSSGAPLNVEAVDFGVVGRQSVFTVVLSGHATVSDAVQKGDVVRFGVKNTRISRALRRSLDPSAFPSSVRMITPYTVREGEGQEVRFAVELKGPVPYFLKTDGNRVIFSVDNGPFDEPAPERVSTIAIPVGASPQPKRESQGKGGMVSSPLTVGGTAAKTEEIPETFFMQQDKGPKYTGQKISLVFDDADIRKILQLIAEVSDLNIIVADEVKGNITLRLQDVPWDQALDLIMDIKDLGMLREGNVVRVLPRVKIREMEESKFTAARTKEKLEDLVTEVISVSYSSLGNVAGPSRELLTERGKITEDSRNKQLIITDVPSVVAEVKKLVKILDTPERQVMIEARIVEANSSFSRDLGVKWGLAYDDVSGGSGDISRFNAGLGGSFLIPPPAAGSVGAAGLGTGITFGRVGIDSTVLDLRISALESAGEGKVISTPRVSTLNGGEAKISQGTKIPYVSSDGDQVKTEFVDANLELQVQPVINPDNSIILDIKATNSSIGSNVSVGVGSAPSIDTKEAATKVLVRDGETTVIGGIFVETENSNEVGVPLLMKIPILGHLFKSTNTTATRAELLVFITPRIVQ